MVPAKLLEILGTVLDHLEVTIIVAFLLIVIGYFRQGLIDFSSFFVAVRVHGEWRTKLIRSKTRPAQSVNENFESGSQIGPGWILAMGAGQRWDHVWTNVARQSTGPGPCDINNHLGKSTHHHLDPAADTPHEEITLHQFFNKVWGESKVISGGNLVYKLRGQVIGEKLSLVFREKEGFDSGAILLDIKSRSIMTGFEVGFDPDGNIYSCPYDWTRRSA